jgi:hypothetical protein
MRLPLRNAHQAVPAQEWQNTSEPESARQWPDEGAHGYKTGSSVLRLDVPHEAMHRRVGTPLTVRHKRSVTILSKARPLPSMLICTEAACGISRYWKLVK